MRKSILGTAVFLVFVVNSAIAANVDVRVGAPGVNVHVGSQPPPQQVIVERERTVVVKEKHDQGKHKGQKKHKKHKKEKHD